MLVTGLIADSCPNGDDCPRIHDTDGDDVLVQGARVDPAVAGIELGDPDEGLVRVPAALVRPERMTLPELSQFLRDHHDADLLRVEVRPAYSALSDGGDFARFVAGEASPLEGESWRARLRAEAGEGRHRRKVHVVTGQKLSEYERYEFQWGFVGTTSAGEDVRIGTAAGWPELADLPDFWVIDGGIVVQQVYGSDNRFSYAHVVTDVADAAMYRAVAGALWRDSVPFAQWWAAHPDEHRKARAA